MSKKTSKAEKQVREETPNVVPKDAQAAEEPKQPEAPKAPDESLLPRIVVWYDSRQAGEYYTLEQAAKELKTTPDELKAQLLALRKGGALPQALAHITDNLEG